MRTAFGRLFEFSIHYDPCFQESGEYGHKLLIRHFAADQLQDESMRNFIKERFQVYRYCPFSPFFHQPL